MVPLLFSTIEVTRQVFYRTSLSYAIVNLKPIVPGHVLVIPCRPVPRLTDLTTPELTSLMSSVQNVGRVIERAYGGDALTVACQDGKAAGQSIPHVHFHLIPRKFKGDVFSGRNDEIYPALEEAEESLPGHFEHLQQASESSEYQPLRMDADEDRQPRSLEDMEKEANWLQSFFPKDFLEMKN
ncbi:HIT-like domain-containing protein [Hygrophoropsis aurantiaca]|uniref:HIT-like domain-containing protein n=1 Tax=Hygrophoropsis aurantiaca TaxID=72124 RepID=A0ACB8AN44_9AGAM|nr:HIT-like domain-containing protein [Hygrophoropsis aurantiaca]